MSPTIVQLPVRLTPLVGRQSELNDIVQAVTRCRLLTLTGPGGTGKTRLALAAARSAGASFPAGVCWVELAQIEDPGIVAHAVATRLGVPDTPGAGHHRGGGLLPRRTSGPGRAGQLRASRGSGGQPDREPARGLPGPLDDVRGIASALQVLGSVAREQGRYARAVELHAESLAVAEAAGDRWAVASAHGYLGFVSWLQRDFDRATEEASTALAMFRDLGDVEGTAWSLISLGTIARYQGEAERVSALLTESRSLSEGIGFREGIA